MFNMKCLIKKIWLSFIKKDNCIRWINKKHAYRIFNLNYKIAYFIYLSKHELFWYNVSDSWKWKCIQILHFIKFIR